MLRGLVWHLPCATAAATHLASSTPLTVNTNRSSTQGPMTPKRPAPSSTSSDAALMPPAPPSTTSSKRRRRTTHAQHHRPSPLLSTKRQPTRGTRQQRSHTPAAAQWANGRHWAEPAEPRPIMFLFATPTPIQSSPSPPTPSRAPSRNSSSSARSGTLRASALTRDTPRCVLTAITEPSVLDVAHATPPLARGAKADTFYGFLGLFLGGESYYFDTGAIEMAPVPYSGTWSGDYDASIVSSYDITLHFPAVPPPSLPLHLHL
ncbi:uncharacterized protein LAJ45_10164 [Morchella importuna]|uniref:uncharacterized protein n=1 Tax=Morchella importuna TaxID=1174673 RepID=UPI001E8D2F21|nr:uncharacterized protein LAJ45_10164 [Morchella importuna]KAH8145839.1 hypothetical protein LAJ45_10164 [Morchella importuna]